MNLKAWIEAMRLRTLPVSVAGVICATALALMAGGFHCVQATIWQVLAVVGAVAADFCNDYYDL